MSDRIQFLRLIRSVFTRRPMLPRLKGTRPARHPAYGSAAEGRLAACRRMTDAALRRRLDRGAWSGTSRRAALAVLRERIAAADAACPVPVVPAREEAAS